MPKSTMKAGKGKIACQGVVITKAEKEEAAKKAAEKSATRNTSQNEEN